MDFRPTGGQEAVLEAAEPICQHHSPFETNQTRLPASEEWLDHQAWKDLAAANLLGLCLSEEFGGSGQGLLELCTLLIQVGRAVVRVPVLWSTVAALAIERYGSETLKRELLPGVCNGSLLLTCALVERGSRSYLDVTAQANREKDGWVLTGEKDFVPFSQAAHRLVVPALAPDGRVGLFVVDPAAQGLTHSSLETTNNEPQATLTLDGVRVEPDCFLGSENPAENPLTFVYERATLGLCALEAGVIRGALEAAARYTSSREQFGRPIATFQAAAMKLADSYIDEQSALVTLWQAAWLLEEGLPASSEVDVAKFWAAEAGQRVVSNAHHLHGGIGVDVDYPLHQYLLFSKVNELSLGSATYQLGALAAAMAQGGVRARYVS